MGQVAVNLNGRSYRFDCGDGEEPRLKELAAHVKSRFEALSREFGNVGEDRLLLMVSLLIADELWDARASQGNAKADESSSDAKSDRQKGGAESGRGAMGRKTQPETKKSA